MDKTYFVSHSAIRLCIHYVSIK